MNYIDKIASRIGRLCGMDSCNPRNTALLRSYAVLALAKGTDVTLADVHDAWSAWQVATDPWHRSIVPFDDLSDEVKALDAPYRDAISEVAKGIEKARQ